MLYEYKGLFYEAFDSDLEYYCEITDPEDIVLFYTDYYQDVEDAEKEAENWIDEHVKSGQKEGDRIEVVGIDYDYIGRCKELARELIELLTFLNTDEDAEVMFAPSSGDFDEELSGLLAEICWFHTD